jgi:hypothetical protein
MYCLILTKIGYVNKFLVNLLNIKFQENPFNSSEAVTSR